jgi:hypothetical protein
MSPSPDYSGLSHLARPVPARLFAMSAWPIRRSGQSMIWSRLGLTVSKLAALVVAIGYIAAALFDGNSIVKGMTRGCFCWFLNPSRNKPKASYRGQSKVAKRTEPQ